MTCNRNSKNACNKPQFVQFPSEKMHCHFYLLPNNVHWNVAFKSQCRFARFGLLWLCLIHGRHAVFVFNSDTVLVCNLFTPFGRPSALPCHTIWQMQLWLLQWIFQWNSTCFIVSFYHVVICCLRWISNRSNRIFIEWFLALWLPLHVREYGMRLLFINVQKLCHMSTDAEMFSVFGCSMNSVYLFGSHIHHVAY